MPTTPTPTKPTPSLPQPDETTGDPGDPTDDTTNCHPICLPGGRRCGYRGPLETLFLL